MGHRQFMPKSGLRPVPRLSGPCGSLIPLSGLPHRFVMNAAVVPSTTAAFFMCRFLSRARPPVSLRDTGPIQRLCVFPPGH